MAVTLANWTKESNKHDVGCRGVRERATDVAVGNENVPVQIATDRPAKR